jgi:hypothetical protein
VLQRGRPFPTTCPSGWKRRSPEKRRKRLPNVFAPRKKFLQTISRIGYILTILGIFRLRRTKPDWPRPYKAFGYPVMPLLHVLLAGAICILLFFYKPRFTWPGLGIVLLGIPIHYGITKNTSRANLADGPP